MYPKDMDKTHLSSDRNCETQEPSEDNVNKIPPGDDSSNPSQNSGVVDTSVRPKVRKPRKNPKKDETNVGASSSKVSKKPTSGAQAMSAGNSPNSTLSSLLEKLKKAEAMLLSENMLIMTAQKRCDDNKVSPDEVKQFQKQLDDTVEMREASKLKMADGVKEWLNTLEDPVDDKMEFTDESGKDGQQQQSEKPHCSSSNKSANNE